MHPFLSGSRYKIPRHTFPPRRPMREGAQLEVATSAKRRRSKAHATSRTLIKEPIYFSIYHAYKTCFEVSFLIEKMQVACVRPIKCPSPLPYAESWTAESCLFSGDGRVLGRSQRAIDPLTANPSIHHIVLVSLS